MNKIKLAVFLPPFVVCVAAIVLSFRNPGTFNQVIDSASKWSSSTFGWLISLASFGMVVLCVAIFFSPFGRTVLGGARRQAPAPTLADVHGGPDHEHRRRDLVLVRI
jgi:glycine betaine transporter